MIVNICEYTGEAEAILSLPGAVRPEDAASNTIMVVVVDLWCMADRDGKSMQDTRRYDVTMGNKSDDFGFGYWRTVSWDWQFDVFTEGCDCVVVAFPEASLAVINNPKILGVEISKDEAACAGRKALFRDWMDGPG